jgi:uncharacterized protein YaaN involved in tellurite resistance
MNKVAEKQGPLAVDEREAVAQDLGLTDPAGIGQLEVDPELEAQADKHLAALLAPDQDHGVAREAIDNLGLKTQQQAAHKSQMLKEPIKNLSQGGEDGGEVATSLVSLKEQVEDLDPAGVDFSVNGFIKMFRWIPGIGKPMSRFFTKYQSAQAVIDAIVKSLENGRDQLIRDNRTLSGDQKALRENTHRLTKIIQLAMVLDTKLQHKVDNDLDLQPEDRQFIQEELLFPLRQRIVDLQQTLAVNQQGVLTMEIIIRNNRELIRGVNRALNVTVTALQIAVAVALALNHQKIVLDKITALNTTTSNLIGDTAARLRGQGVEIHKQAASTSLDMDKLKGAFRDINAAMEDISTFRQQALPQMASNILELDAETEKCEEAIQRMERGRAVQAKLNIDIEDEVIA